MTRIGLIVNPLSQRNKRGLPALRRAVEDCAPLVDCFELDGMESLGPALERFSRAGHPLVAIAGGDGTVVAAMTEYLLRRPQLERPAFALLCAGMTNMTAADIGMRGRPHRALRKLAALFSAGEAAWRSALAERRPLIISGGGLEAPQAGFFLGGAGVYQAVEYCRAKVHTLGLEAEWANGVTLASLLVQQAVSGHLLRGRPVTWRWDAGERQSDSLSVLLATTLNKLVVGTRPFWNQPDDPGARQGFSVSLIAKRGPAFWWKLPRLLYGRADRKLDLDGCRSGQAQVLELWMDSPFTLDGELLAADSGEALRVELGEACRFLRV